MSEELEEIKQPNSLDECFTLLNEVLSDKLLFKNTLESNVLAMSHFSLGRWLRNNWYLWWNENLAKEYAKNNYPQVKPKIVQYFNDDLKIFHADDMSSIIILSYHRHLNGKELKVQEQVNKYLKFWADGKIGEEE